MSRWSIADEGFRLMSRSKTSRRSRFALVSACASACIGPKAIYTLIRFRSGGERVMEGLKRGGAAIVGVAE